MDAQAPLAFLRYFQDLKDPRRPNVRHSFSDILTIAILAVLCRADDFDEIVLWAQLRREWLAGFLELPNGIPHPDTFRRIFARLDPAGFERCFGAWTQSLAESLHGQVVAIDGKSLRHSFQRAWDQQMIHMVSAWASENQLLLGQIAVDEKSNEITAVPRLLELLNLKGATVTLDAMGTQRAIAEQIVKQKADYVLAVKDNQPELCQKVTSLLDDAILENFKGMSYGYHEATNAGHGRTEIRRVWVTDEVRWLGPQLRARWPRLKSVAVVEAIRRLDNGQSSTERRYFISSRAGTDAAWMAHAIRSHWGIENRLHWPLDVTFGEDASRMRKDFAAENVSRLRRLALNLLRMVPGKMSMKRKRFACSLDLDYLLKALSHQP
jgi:predicted transposase YbfD/YdcC